MDTTWKKDGLLFGTLSEEDCAKGGKWTVGDRIQPDEPGYSEIVMYKTWIARADKYSPGAYRFKDRTWTRLYEYVLTMLGILTALEKNRSSGKVTRTLLHFGKAASIDPHTLRSWELPPEQEEVRGGTILCLGEGIYTDDGFLFESWTPATAAGRLHRSLTQLRLHAEYVEVFIGSLLCHFDGNEQLLQPGDFVYVRVGTDVRFEAGKPDTRGIVLYYR